MDTDQLSSFADVLFHARPSWISSGSTGKCDSQFLMRMAYHARANAVVEIGTGSGFSTLLLCHALKLAHDSGLVGSNFTITTYDSVPTFYGDRSKRVGDAAREQLPETLLRHIIFRNPATAADLQKYHAPNDIKFLFIDANHRHPAPTVDMLLALPYLAPRATVVLHDINLPLINPSWPGWGVKFLFDAIQVPKHVPSELDLPNIGSFVVPEDKALLENQLRSILSVHEWQTPVNESDLKTLGIERPQLPVAGRL